MPELPEVEIARRNLDRWAKGRTIVRAKAVPSRLLGKKSPATFAAVLKGARVEETERRGKNIVVRLSKSGKPPIGVRGGAPSSPKGEIGLHVHLGMTGKLLRRKKADPPPRFSRVRFDLDDGQTVHYCDLRFFGKLDLGPIEEVREHAFEDLGPDLLLDSISPGLLEEKLRKRSAPLKIVLMDQSVVAGLGNIHAAEALWRAKLSPFRPANELDAAKRKQLVAGIHASIRFALDEEDDEDDIVYVEEPGSENPFLVYEREGQRCPRRGCGGTIARLTQGGRSTYWCTRCQK